MTLRFRAHSCCSGCTGFSGRESEHCAEGTPVHNAGYMDMIKLLAKSFPKLDEGLRQVLTVAF